MAPTVTLKLMTNIPAIGTVKFIDRYEEKENPNQPGKMMAEQWGFKGTFDMGDGQGPREGRIYCDSYQLSADPIQLGLAIPDGTDARTGAQRYKWTEIGKIHLVKREDGRKRVIQIARVGEASGVGVPHAITLPIPPGPAPATAPVRAVAQQMATTIDQAILQQHTTGERRASAGQNPADYAEHDPWAALEARYARCVEIACRTWTTHGEQIDDGALVAAAAHLSIEANKRNLPVEPIAYSLGTTGGVSPTPTKATVDTSGPPRPEQIAQFRALAGSETFTSAERGTWLERLGQHLYSNDDQSLRNDLTRMQHLVKTRTTKTPPPATRTAGGPGMPGQGFDEMPEALDPELDTLPF